MKSIRCLSVLILAFAALGSGARADQFQALEPEQAERVLDLLRPGTLFGRWQSHGGGGPELFVLESARVVDSGPYSEVEVVAEPFAALVERGGQLAPVLRDDPGETFRVDAAYLYVPYGDLPSVRINAARLLELRSEFFPDGAHVDRLAFEIPASVFAAASRRAGSRSPAPRRGLSDTVPGSDADGSAPVPSRLASRLTAFVMDFRSSEASYYEAGDEAFYEADERRARAFFAGARLVPADGPDAAAQGVEAFRVVNAAGDPGGVIEGDVWVFFAGAGAGVGADGAFSGRVRRLVLDLDGGLWVAEPDGRSVDTYWIHD